jgi:hypothetical protein
MRKTLLLLALSAGFMGVTNAQSIAFEPGEAGVPFAKPAHIEQKGIKHSSRVANTVNLRMSHTDAVVEAYGPSNFRLTSFVDFFTDSLMFYSFNGALGSAGFHAAGCIFNPYNQFFDEPLPLGTEYRLDTIWFGGVYTRLQNNTVGDTLRLQVSFGPSTATGTNAASNANWVQLRYNASAPPALANRAVMGQLFAAQPAQHGFGGNLGAQTVQIDYILTADDTVSNPALNPNYPYIPFVMPGGGINIPANNWVGSSVRFRTGNPYQLGDVIWSNDTVQPIHNSYRPLANIENDPPQYGFFFDSTGTSQVLLKSIRYQAGTTNFFFSPQADRGYWIDFSIQATLPGVSVENIAADVARIGNIYPNPVNAGNQLILPIELKRNSKVSYSIANYMGQTVAFENAGQLFEGAHRLEVNTHGLNAGIYFMNLNIDGITQPIRFVVNK